MSNSGFFFGGEQETEQPWGFSGEQKTGQPWGFFCGAKIRGAVVCFFWRRKQRQLGLIYTAGLGEIFINLF